jgi:hypothetical protein
MQEPRDASWFWSLPAKGPKAIFSTVAIFTLILIADPFCAKRSLAGWVSHNFEHMWPAFSPHTQNMGAVVLFISG